MSDCCRASSVGSDKKLFDDLLSVLSRLSARPLDKVLMDMSVGTKLAAYTRLVEEAKRIAEALEEMGHT